MLKLWEHAVRVSEMGYNRTNSGLTRRAACEHAPSVSGGCMSAHSDPGEDALLDLESKSNDELRSLLDELYEEEQKISYRRRVLHGKIDILRSELVNRMKGEREAGADVITGRDVDRLINILASDLRGVSRFDVTAPLQDEELDLGSEE